MELITAAYCLPLTDDQVLLENSGIAVQDGRIVDIGTREELTSRHPHIVEQHFDASVLMPGLINAHCRLDLIDFQEKALAERDLLSGGPTDFITYLTESVAYRRNASAEQLMASMQKGTRRLVETGVTCIGDVTFCEGAFELINEMGLRARISPEIIGGTGETPQEQYEVALALAEKYLNADNDRIRVGLAPAAPYLLSRNLLRIIAEHARQMNVPLQISAAQSFAEMEFFFDSQGPIATQLFPSLGWNDLPPAHMKTPLQFLESINFFATPTSIVGGMHLAAGDIPLLSRSNVSVVHCPLFAQVMKLGTLPLQKLNDAGVNIGIGSPLWHTRLGFSMWEELRIAGSGTLQPVPSAHHLLRMATSGSARALGWNDQVGTLEKNKRADYIVVHAPKAGSTEELCSELIRNTAPQHVQRVAVSGRILKDSAV